MSVGMDARVARIRAEDFWSRVDRKNASDCWDWLGSKQSSGYGLVGLTGTSIGAHRAAYELAVGPIPPGAHIDHLCRNRACCNPAHLEPVTQAENNRRGWISRFGFIPRDMCGTAARYANGCRCDECRRAEREQTQARPVKTHGTTTGYSYGCRCDACKEAQRGLPRRHFTADERRERSERVKADPSLVSTHGTVSAYIYWGCRCEPCRAGNAERFRDAAATRASRLALDPSLATHGIRSTYINWGCRCEPCTEANSNACRSYAANRRAS